MKPSRQPSLDFVQLAALAQDLESSHAHRLRATEETEYVLDANVMWFFQQQLDEDDERIQDYVAAAIGAQNAASLIRTSIEKLSAKKHKLLMTQSHRYETDVAFASEVPQDYDGLRNTLLQVFESAISRQFHSSTPETLPMQIVNELKTNYRDHFRLLTDILGRKPQKKRYTDSLVRTLRPTRYTRIPPDLAKTLKKIAFILREGDRRPRFSVQQDINALRDVALCNATKGKHRVVLVTFDKRLLQAVRLVQSWKEPWADYLVAESCQTFWVWHLTDPTIANHPAAQVLQDVMDDFRRKSRQLFRAALPEDRDQPIDEDEPIWLTNKSTLDNLLNNYKVGQQHKHYPNSNSTDDDFEIGVIRQVESTLRKVLALEQNTSGDSLAVIQKACRLFFNEVEEILPLFGLIVSDVFERETTLTHMLQKYGVEKTAFFDALNEEIQQHARESLYIIGASSLVAPKTIQAIYYFSRTEQLSPPSRRFVHRVPLPIQSDEFNLVEVVRLVTNDQAKLEVRYDELIKIAQFAGPIADLTVAYILANSGQWDEAEDICRGILSRSERINLDGPVYNEARLLLAAILRIFKTSFQKLIEAEMLLKMAADSQACRPSADKNDVRIRLEFIAVSLNRLLLERYRSVTSGHGFEKCASVNEAEDAFHALIKLKSELPDAPHLPSALREKIIANINVNCCLITHFVAPSAANKMIDKAAFGCILREALARLFAHTNRISYFEEIVVLFVALSSWDMVKQYGYQELELIGLLKSRLSRVLQKDHRTNEFENWIYRHIGEKLNVIGY